MKRLQEHYDAAEALGFEVVGVFLQGSQNYELDYEGSDIDSKAIVIPRIKDVVMNEKPVSTTHIMENNEHVDLKDIRLMFECFRKQNINFVEILFTKYKIMNPKYAHLFQPLFENKEFIARYNTYAALSCMVGMAMEKYKALEHPYPATLEKIEKFGYDPKQLHHIIRLNGFMYRYISNEFYENCLVPINKEYLIEVKRGVHTLDEARAIAKTMCENTMAMRDTYVANHPIEKKEMVYDLLNTVLLDIFREAFRLELGVEKEEKNYGTSQSRSSVRSLHWRNV
jgi:predicted nucleotidyltransferase